VKQVIFFVDVAVTVAETVYARPRPGSELVQVNWIPLESSRIGFVHLSSWF